MTAPPGTWSPPPTLLAPPSSLRAVTICEHARWAANALTADDCARLRAAMTAPMHPVGVQGGADVSDARTGSLRATAWSPELASQLWEKLRAMIPPEREMTHTTPTDWHAPTPHRRWRAHEISPLLRFMRYEKGGLHHPHYDNSYDYGDGRRTLMSFVLYLTDASPGGRTRIVRDGQEHLAMPSRTHDDWSRPARDDEVIAAVVPTQGAMLMFDHRVCHDIERYEGDSPRIIIRGDVVFTSMRPPVP